MIVAILGDDPKKFMGHLEKIMEIMESPDSSFIVTDTPLGRVALKYLTERRFQKCKIFNVAGSTTKSNYPVEGSFKTEQEMMTIVKLLADIVIE